MHVPVCVYVLLLLLLLYVCVCMRACVCVCVCKRERCEKMVGGSAENQEDRGSEGNREKLYDHGCSSNSRKEQRVTVGRRKRRATHSKVSLESLGAPVGEVAADLAGVADVQAVQLVQPVRDGLKQQDTEC